LLREDNPIGMVLASHGVRLAEAREIVRKTDAPPAASGGISSDDDLLQVDQIKALVRQLARLPSGGNDARALTDRILRALDALKPPPRE
jgi:hypothetical protein